MRKIISIPLKLRIPCQTFSDVMVFPSLGMTHIAPMYRTAQETIMQILQASFRPFVSPIMV